MGADFTLTGTATGAVQATEAVNKSLDKTEKTADRSAAAMKRLEDQAKRLAAQVDPQTRYNQQMERLALLIAKGGLSIEHAQIAAGKYWRELHPVKQNLEAVARTQEKVFDPTSAARFVASFASVGTATQLIRSELEKIAEIHERIAQRSLGTALSEEELRANISGFAPAQRKQALADARRIATQRGLPQNVVNYALSGTASAIGDLGLATKLVETATGISRNPSDIPVIAAGLGDIINTANIRDPREALGFLNLVQKNSRLTTPKDVASQIGKVSAAYTSAGASAAYGAAIFNAISKGAADPTGELSRTQAINLIRVSEKWLAGTGQFKPEQIDTVQERFNLLFNDRKLAERFIATADTGRGATRGAVAKLLYGDAQVRGAFDQSLADLSDPRRLRTAADDLLRFVNAGDVQGSARLNQGVASAVEQSDLRQAGRGILTKENRERIIEARAAATGVPNFVERAFLFAQTGPSLTADEAVPLLQTTIAGQEEYRRQFGSQGASRDEGVATLKSILGELQRSTRRRNNVDRPE